MNKKDVFEEVDKVIENPSTVIPSLSIEDIRLLLIQCVHAYTDNVIELHIFIDIATNIKRYSTLVLSDDVNKAIADINKLEKNQSNINEILTDILQNLMKYR